MRKGKTRIFHPKKKHITNSLPMTNKSGLPDNPLSVTVPGYHFSRAQSGKQTKLIFRKDFKFSGNRAVFLESLKFFYIKKQRNSVVLLKVNLLEVVERNQNITLIVVKSKSQPAYYVI